MSSVPHSCEDFGRPYRWLFSRIDDNEIIATCTACRAEMRISLLQPMMWGDMKWLREPCLNFQAEVAGARQKQLEEDRIRKSKDNDKLMSTDQASGCAHQFAVFDFTSQGKFAARCEKCSAFEHFSLFARGEPVSTLDTLPLLAEVRNAVNKARWLAYRANSAARSQQQDAK